MNRNLYDILGVAIDATVEEIRKAFRSRAKTAHPDQGGDPAAFRAIQVAYDVLTDTDRRAYYDATGKATAKQPEQDPIFTEAMAFLNNLMMTVLKEEIAPGVDVAKEMARAVDDQHKVITEARRQIVELKQRAEKQARRWKRKSTGQPNLMAGMITYYITHLETKLGHCERDCKILERGREILLDHAFEVEPLPPKAERSAADFAFIPGQGEVTVFTVNDMTEFFDLMRGKKPRSKGK